MTEKAITFYAFRLESCALNHFESGKVFYIGNNYFYVYLVSVLLLQKEAVEHVGHSFRNCREARPGALDGVLRWRNSIAITILVLGIDIPEGHSFSEQGLLAFLAQIRHDVVVYAASFWIIGAFWVQHHAVFRYFRSCDRWLLWLNTLFLFSTTLIPFLAKLKSIYKYEPKVVLLFATGFILCGLSLLAIWRYAVAKSEFHRTSPIDPAVIRSMTRRLLITPVISAAAVGLSFLNVHLGTYAFLAIPLFYLSHRTVDTRLKKPEDASA